MNAPRIGKTSAIVYCCRTNKFVCVSSVITSRWVNLRTLFSDKPDSDKILFWLSNVKIENKFQVGRLPHILLSRSFRSFMTFCSHTLANSTQNNLHLYDLLVNRLQKTVHITSFCHQFMRIYAVEG